ncbi:unnamed protein product [Urochloa decumbens]|uniref:Uncharacterized protein n=1 Tax=Urochloa decumbens TaxID=240449 RepID=A0ABC9BSZ0_9POAL
MAEIALSLVPRLIQVISVLAEKEATLLRSVPENTRYIKDELQTIGAFLGDGLIDDIQEDNPKYQMVKPWAEQVKDLAYDMEDCLEEHIIVLSQRLSWSQKILNFKALHHLAARLTDLRSRIVEVSERNRRYHLVPPYESASSNTTITVVLDHVRSRFLKGKTQNDTSGDMKKEEVVSLFEAPRTSTSIQDSTSTEALKKAAIAGMCGSGTTLAREIYDENKSHFPNCHAWIELPPVVNITKVFKNIIAQLSLDPPTHAGYISEEEELAYHILGQLKGKRFLIVFDGLWTSRAWIRIKRALPRISRTGSRVIVTTELLHIAMHYIGSGTVFQSVPLLPELRSFESLKKSVLKAKNRKMSPEDKEDFEDLGPDILKLDKPEPPFDTIAKVVKKCGGLQLAIQTFAELLASNLPQQWGKLCEDLPSLLYNDPRLSKIKRVMTRSYKCLPPYLKPCFLYLSIFPEDSNIDVETVLHRWVAEGLVREVTGMSPKAVAEGYLSELFDRNLIKATKLRRNRSCKTCWIHPMMRDILVMTAQEEIFSITVGKYQNSTVPAKRFRHLALDGQSDRKLVKWIDLSGIRSLTVFEEPSESIASLVCSSQMKTLRILDFSKASPKISQQDIRNIGELFHLRYLNLYRSSIRELPSWIGMLPFLQLLNLKKTQITSLPSEITRLERLQIIRASSCSCNSEGVLIPKGMENLADIEWLDVVDVRGSTYSALKALWKLTRLKHLGLTGLTKRNSEEVTDTLQKLSPSLISLYLGAHRRSNGTLSYLPAKMSSLQFPRLETIKLDGHIRTMPEWIYHSLTLSVVKLYRTNLQQNDIDGLDRIHSLTTLSLLDSSYVGQQLFFYAGSFAGLKRLDLVGLPNLQVVKFRQKAVRRIRELTVKSCTLSLFSNKNLIKGLWVYSIDSGVRVEETE